MKLLIPRQTGFFVILLGLLTSNFKPVTNQSPGNLLKQMDWLLGTWVNNSYGQPIYENWNKNGPAVYKGKSYKLKGGDTLFFEKIDLTEKDSELYYIPVVTNQNEGKPIPFKLSSSVGKKFVFENPGHDFPQKILYQYISHDSLYAEVSGIENGKQRKESFPMKRIN